MHGMMQLPQPADPAPVFERRRRLLVAMLPSPERGLFGRLQALHQQVKDSELWPLVLVSYMCLSIHIVIKVSTQNQRVCEFASLRTLRWTRKWVWGFRMRGRKCLRVLTNSLHGMAAAAIILKASRRRSCHLRFGLVPSLPWKVLVSNSVGAPRAPTLVDCMHQTHRDWRQASIACLTNDAQKFVTMGSPLRDTARVE